MERTSVLDLHTALYKYPLLAIVLHPGMQRCQISTLCLYLAILLDHLSLGHGSHKGAATFHCTGQEMRA